MTWQMVVQWTCDKVGCGTVAYVNPAGLADANPLPPGWTKVGFSTHWCDKHEPPVQRTSPIGMAVGLGEPGLRDV